MQAPEAPLPAEMLPVLRQDLTILDGGAAADGSATFLIFDALRNRYFRIGEQTVEILGGWRATAPAMLAAKLSKSLNRHVSEAELSKTARFLTANCLVETSADNRWRALYGQYAASRQVLWKKIVHNYLFFRIPLVRPQRFLDIAWPLVSPLFSRQAAIIFAAIAILSLYLVSRQWETFATTFLGFLTLDGLLVYGLSLALIKTLHELGHAFMARKYSVEVPVIGIAFLVLFPILYTDTTGAHALKSRAERLNIDLAGVYAELALASLCTFLWVLLPDGPLRSIAFSTATLSWVTSIAVNLNPFMRFDGYYVLSDLTGIENLQQRGFALARWRLRELLFYLGDPAPEVMPGNWRRLLVLHAWGTWIYRLFLFLGIALLVYGFFVKLVGIALFVVEIAWFIALPVWRELVQWWQLRERIAASRRTLATLGTVLLLVLLAVCPWSRSVNIPAVARIEGVVSLYAPVPARLAGFETVEGKRVRQGEVLFQLVSPDLEDELLRVHAELALVSARLARLAADARDRSLRIVLETRERYLREEQAGLLRQKAALTIAAPRDGTISNLDTRLMAGMWLNSHHRLAVLLPANNDPHDGHASSAGLEIKGLVSEAGFNRIAVGAAGRFVPDDPQLSPFPVILQERQPISAVRLDEPVLAETQGGLVPVHAESGREELKPRGAWFPVRLSPANGAAVDAAVFAHPSRGQVVLDADPESFAARVFRQVASVLIREAGF